MNTVKTNCRALMLVIAVVLALVAAVPPVVGLAQEADDPIGGHNPPPGETDAPEGGFPGGAEDDAVVGHNDPPDYTAPPEVEDGAIPGGAAQEEPGDDVVVRIDPIVEEPPAFNCSAVPNAPGCDGEDDGSASEPTRPEPPTSGTFTPRLEDDTARTWRGSPVVLDLFRNDRGASDLQIAQWTSPESGRVVCDREEGRCTYTPSRETRGVDWFAYIAQDESGAYAVADVGIKVLPRKLCPSPDYTGCSRKGEVVRAR